MFRNVYSVNIICAVLIFMLFLLTSVPTYYAFEGIFKKNAEHIVDLNSEKIFSKIASNVKPFVNVSLAMSYDMNFHEIILENDVEHPSEENIRRISEYLESYDNRYEFESVFFVSATTGHYFHCEEGIRHTISKENPRDAWFYAFLNADTQYQFDSDPVNYGGNNSLLFVNCKVYDAKGKFLGIVGVSQDHLNIQDALTAQEKEFSIHAYIVQANGERKFSTGSDNQWEEFGESGIFEEDMGLCGYSAEKQVFVASLIASYTDHVVRVWHSHCGTKEFVNVRYLPTMDKYLVVEQNTRDFDREVRRTVRLNLFISLGAALGVLAIIMKLNQCYHRRMTRFAETDKMTGLKNRVGYEHAMTEARNSIDAREQFGIGIFDLNNLKEINDECGHQIGDSYLQKFAEQLKTHFADCRIFRIGGDEFVVFFERAECNEKTVLDRAERVCAMEYPLPCEFKHARKSAAFGCAFKSRDLNTLGKIFKVADMRMYADKLNGKE